MKRSKRRRVSPLEAVVAVGKREEEERQERRNNQR